MSFRRGKTLLLVCCTTLALAALPALVLAQAPASIFQLNGDPTSNGSQCTYGATTATCDSWNLINGTGSSGKEYIQLLNGGLQRCKPHLQLGLFEHEHAQQGHTQRGLRRRLHHQRL